MPQTLGRQEMLQQDANEFKGKVRAVADFVRRISKHRHAQTTGVGEWTTWDEGHKLKKWWYIYIHNTYFRKYVVRVNMNYVKIF